MKIAFNPSTVAALITPPNNKDITFDLRGRNIFARGVKFCGTDTNTWRDIKINNVSIGSNILDLRNGSNTTLTNINGVVTINSTWRPVVDNLTSDSTTSSLSANQGRVLAGLINGKSDSGHNHDGRYLRLNGSDTMQGNLYLHSYGTSYIGKGSGDKSGADFTEANIVIRSWWGISFKSHDDIVRTYIDTRTGNIGTKGVLNAVGAVIQGRVYNDGDDEGIIIKPASNGYAGLILGAHNSERSVFYLTKGNPFWRYNNGSANLDIKHPKKSGTIALTSDIPSSLKNPYSLTTFGVVYDGSTAKTVTTSTFISQVTEGTSTVTDGTMFITSWASDNGFADTNAVNVPYKRKAIHLWEYIKAKTDSLYATKGHNHDDRYLKLTGGTMSGTICRNSGGATISGRDNAIIRQTHAPGGSSWNPIACVDTETGTWTLGHLSSGDSDTNFHFCFSTNTDYNAGNNNGNYVTLRNKVGTIALLSEIPDKNSWNYDDRYLKLTGGTMNGNARIGYGSGNLYIGNSGNDGWVAVQDICSQDSIGDGKWSIRVDGTASFQSIKFPSNRLITQVSNGSNSPLRGIKLPRLDSNAIGIFSRVGNGNDEGGIILSEDTCVIYNSFDTGWGLSVRDKDITQTDISGDNTIAFGVRQDYRAYSLGGFEKSGSDNSYVLLGGGGHKALSDFSISGHTHSSITIPVCSSLDENSDIFRVEYAGGSNSVATKPSGVDAFGVIRLRTAAGWYGQIMMSANTTPGIYYRNANGLSSSVGWKKLLDSSNFNSYSPKLDGTGASGTWNISITGNANTVDNIHATGFLRWKGMQNIGSNAPFQAVVDIMKDTSKLNDGGLAFYSYADDEYTVLIGSRNDAARYGNALKWGYANKYLWMIRMINGSPRSSDWEKISAGYADSSGNTDLLDGYHASGLFTNLSNSGNNISITIGGTNKTLTVGYASTATQVSKSLKWTDATGTVQSYNGGTEKSITSLNFPSNQIALNFRHPGDGYATKIQYMTAGNEALVFAAQNSVTSFIFKSGANITNSNLWYDQVPTPTLQLKGQSAYINKLIANGSVPAFNFLVNGSSRFDGKLWQLYSTRTDPNATCIRDSAIACFGEYDDDAMWIGNNTNNGTWIQVSFKGDEDRPSKNYLYNLSLQPLGGNVGIGTSSPTEKLTVNGWIGTNGIYTNRTGSSTDGGVSLYSNVDPMTYGIAFRGTGTYGTHGYVTSASDWATYLTMNDSTTRGWIFRRGDTNVASIAGSGNMAIGQHLEFSNGAHISTNRSTDYHYGYTFNLGDNAKSIGMYSGPVGEAGGVVISPDGCLIYNSSDCGYNLQVRDKDLGSDLTNIATLTFGIEQSGYYAWSRGGFKKNGSSDSYVLLGGGGHKAENALNVSNADKVDGYHYNDFTYKKYIGYNRNGPYNMKIFSKDISSLTWGASYLIFDIFSSGYNSNRVYFGKYEVSLGHWNNTDKNPTVYSRWIFKTNSAYDCIHVIKDLSNYTVDVYIENNLWDCSMGLSIIAIDGFNMVSSNSWVNLPSASGTVQLIGTTYLSFMGNATSATKLQTARKIWGQSFDGTADVSGTLSGVAHIQFSADEAYDIGSNSAASRYIYTYWLGAKSGQKLELGANNSSYGQGLCIDTNLNVGIGTNAPAYKLDVRGNIRATGNSYATHFYESSDKTLKKNIKSILSSANIPKIREFDWKDTREHSYGFIAQELEEQGYGCLVSEVNGKKTVNYTATLALTVAKLQNLINIQNKKISNLTKELKALKYGRKKNS